MEWVRKDYQLESYRLCLVQDDSRKVGVLRFSGSTRAGGRGKKEGLYGLCCVVEVEPSGDILFDREPFFYGNLDHVSQNMRRSFEGELGCYVDKDGRTTYRGTFYAMPVTPFLIGNKKDLLDNLVEEAAGNIGRIVQEARRRIVKHPSTLITQFIHYPDILLRYALERGFYFFAEAHGSKVNRETIDLPDTRIIFTPMGGQPETKKRKFRPEPPLN